MSIFAGLGSVDPTQGGNYPRPGRYEIKIRSCKKAPSKKNGRIHFVAEYEVLKAIKTDEKVEPNGVGSNPSWVVNMEGEYPDLALGNVKAFLYAAYGSLMVSLGEERPSMDQIDEAMGVAAVNEEENPLGGVVLELEAFHKETQKGSLFTRTNWGIPARLLNKAAS